MGPDTPWAATERGIGARPHRVGKIRSGMARGAARRAFGLDAGERIGRYECVAPLAMGGMAEVYLARHRGVAGFQKLVVIKRVLPHLAVDGDFVEMFLKEARLAAALDHPNIAQVTDFGHDGSDYYMVLEWVQGHDLRAVIKAGVAQQGALPLDVALGIASGLASALHHAHEQSDDKGRPLGIVHRDVSPSNVLVATNGAVKVIDFGIARAVGVSRTTRAGVVKGKAGYMSPEQCRDDALDRRTDVFGLGIVLYEMTTGYRLFHASSDFAAMNKITEGRYVQPTEAVEGYPPALEEIVLRCLALDPDDRYPSCDALRADLEAFAMEQRLSLSAAVRSAYLERWLGPPVSPPLPSSVTEVAAASGPTAVVSSAPVGAAAALPPTRPLTVRPKGRSTVLLVALTAGVTGVGVWGLTRLQSSPTPSPRAEPTVVNPEPTVVNPESTAAESKAAVNAAPAAEPGTVPAIIPTPPGAGASSPEPTTAPVAAAGTPATAIDDAPEGSDEIESGPAETTRNKRKRKPSRPSAAAKPKDPVAPSTASADERPSLLPPTRRTKDQQDAR